MRLSLKTKTTILLLVVGMVPLLFFGGLMIYQQRARLHHDVEATVKASADRIASQVDEWFDKSLRAMRAHALLQPLGSMKAEEQIPVLTSLQQSYPWMYLTFTVDLEGHNVARSDGKPLTEYGDRQYFKDVVVGKKELAWETLIGKTSHKPAVVVAVPIRSGGRVVGVLAAAMTIEDISNILANWTTGKTGYAFLVDEKAKVLAHPLEQYVQQQVKLDTNPLVAAYRGNGTAQLVHFNQADGHEAIGYVRATRNDWLVGVQQDYAEVFEPLTQTLQTGLLFLAAAAVLVVLSAFVMAGSLSRPIVELTEAADKMSMGELDEPIVSDRSDEIGALTKSVERLRRSMKAAMSSLRRSESGVLPSRSGVGGPPREPPG